MFAGHLQFFQENWESGRSIGIQALVMKRDIYPLHLSIPLVPWSEQDGCVRIYQYSLVFAVCASGLTHGICCGEEYTVHW